MEQSYVRVLTIVTTIIEDGIARGAFREVDATQAAQLLVGAIDAARTLKIAGVDENAPETFYDAINEFILPRLYQDA